MASTVYTRLPPPPPPPNDAAERDYFNEGEEVMQVPLTKENITLLQALSQPSRLRRRVAPNFETVSWDDPAHMQYSLNGYRPPQSDTNAGRGTPRASDRAPHGAHPPPRTGGNAWIPAAPATGAKERENTRGEEDGVARTHVDHSSTASRRGHGGVPAKADNVDGRLLQRYGEHGELPPSQADAAVRRDNEGAEASRREHPQRPTAPLPSRRAHTPSSVGSANRLPLHQSTRNDESDSDREVSPDGSHLQSYQDAPHDRDGRATAGRLNMRAFEDQYNREPERPARQAGTGENGTTRREDLAMREIYASRDSDDASYQKRSVEVAARAALWNGKPSQQYDHDDYEEEEEEEKEEEEEEEDYDDVNGEGESYSVDSSRPARFKVVPHSESSSSGRGRRAEPRNFSANAKGGRRDYPEENTSDNDDTRNELRTVQDPPHYRRNPLRDQWERARSDNNNNSSISNSSEGRHPRRGHHTRKDKSGRSNPSSDGHGSVDQEELEEEALCGEVRSCDSYDVIAAPSSRRPAPPPRRQQPQRRPPAAPARTAAHPTASPVYATREETAKYQRKKSTTRHNPKAFKNKTTHTWISTNTTTTVILPAATVQLVPLSSYSPVVEEVLPAEEQWASPPYMLNGAPEQAAQGAGYYQHRPSQMIVLDDSEETSASEGRGRVGGSLPQLPRRAYASANPYNTLSSSMPEL